MAGSVAREGEPAAEHNAVVVDRLIAAGAVIVGRTNMTEFAYSGLGINPHTARRSIPGTAPPASPAAPRRRGGIGGGRHGRRRHWLGHRRLGADPGGAVRADGFQAQRLARVHGGRAAAVGHLAAGRHPARRAARLLAVPVTLALDAMDKHVADTFARTLARLAEAGALIDEIEVPEFAELGAINSKGGFTAAEAWAWHRDLIARAGKR